MLPEAPCYDKNFYDTIIFVHNCFLHTAVSIFNPLSEKKEMSNQRFEKDMIVPQITFSNPGGYIFRAKYMMCRKVNTGGHTHLAITIGKNKEKQKSY